MYIHLPSLSSPAGLSPQIKPLLLQKVCGPGTCRRGPATATPAVAVAWQDEQECADDEEGGEGGGHCAGAPGGRERRQQQVRTVAPRQVTMVVGGRMGGGGRRRAAAAVNVLLGVFDLHGQKEKNISLKLLNFFL